MARERPAVVLVEDDERLRDALTGVLTVNGFQVESFSNAEAAVEAAPWATAACLIVDIRLPGMSGLELLQRLRGRGDSMPVIVLTADTRRATRDAAMRLGVSTYLEKPVRGRVLAAAVREAISKRNTSLRGETR
jgi:FixJ family two-component response regulator